MTAHKTLVRASGLPCSARSNCLSLRSSGASSRWRRRGSQLPQQTLASFIDDLARPENDLPDALRAELISIGIWITNEINRMRLGKSDNFGGLIEICAIIHSGLK